MANPTAYYVDADDGNDSTGDGTSGTPWKTVAKALGATGITRDATNGDVIYLQGEDTLTAELDVTTNYGTPTETAPLAFEQWSGQTAGVLNGDGSYSILADTALDYFGFFGLRLRNTGANTIVEGDRAFHVVNCEIDTTTGYGVSMNGTESSVIGCHFHDISGANAVKCSGAAGLNAAYNYLDCAVTQAVIRTYASAYTNIISNIVNVSVAGCDGIAVPLSGYDGAMILHNSILHTGGNGTGSGIYVLGDSSYNQIMNNVVEGFNTGGFGIKVSSASTPQLHGYNHCYNNATQFQWNDELYDYGDDENNTTHTPFDKSGSNTFANRFTYFAPYDTGNMHGGAYPSGCRRDKGAVQHADPAGGGLFIMPSRPNSLLRR